MVQAKHLADELSEHIVAYVIALERSCKFDSAAYEALRQECTRLAATDVCMADGQRAFLASISERPDDYAAAIRNLRANRNFARATFEEFKHAINRGHASQAYGMAASAIEASRHPSNNGVEVCSALYSVGAFGSIDQHVKESSERQMALSASPLIIKVKEIVAVMNQLGVSDLQIAQMLDVAGEFLREEHLLWAGDRPNVTTLSEDQGGPQILFEYFIGVTAKKAAELNWSLSERLIDRELDVQGVDVCFVGIAA